MRADVERYVRSCRSCQCNKASTLKKAGKLQPLSIPGRRWESVSMDFVVKLPKTARGHDAILVLVDRLTKMVHLVPTTESTSATEFAQMFVEHVVKLHGVPESVVSDRGPQFNSIFWATVCKLLRMNRGMSSAYHPESDGQTEREAGPKELGPALVVC
jgi:IS30 family transposase